MTDNTPQPAETAQGSLEQGLAGNYQLSVGEVVKEAWARVAGNKGALWIGALIYIAVNFGISLVLGLFVGGDAPPPMLRRRCPPPKGLLPTPLQTSLPCPWPWGLCCSG